VEYPDFLEFKYEHRCASGAVQEDSGGGI